MAKASSEPKTGLVVTLVVFILMTLTMGVLAYMFHGGQKDAEAKAAEEKKRADAAESLRKEDNAKLKAYQVALGIASAQEAAELAQQQSPALTAAIGELSTAIENKTKAVVSANQSTVAVGGGGAFNVPTQTVFEWKPGASAPTRPIIDQMVNLLALKEVSERAATRAKTAYEQSVALLGRFSEDLQKSAKEYKDRTGEIPTKIAEGIAGAARKADEYRGQFQQESRKFTEQLTEVEAKMGRMEKETANAKANASRLNTQLNNVRQQEADSVDPFKFKQPVGRIVRTDGSTVEINIGSADNLRVGMMFSVQPSNTPQVGVRARTQRGPDGRPYTAYTPKGSVEVIDILGPNLASARIVKQEDAIRDRILTGDLLYNPLWSRGATEHVALFGLFDADGDGRDDIQTVIRDLSKMGVVVDAWFDLASGRWVGEVTTNTAYAIEGQTPGLTASDVNSSAKANVISAIARARDEVKAKAVQVLKARDVFPRVGYPFRLDVSTDAVNRAAVPYMRTMATPAEQPAGTGM